MALWIIFAVLLVLLLASVGLKIYTGKRLDSIDGFVGTAKSGDLERGRKGGKS